jgi:hypothetical protein
VEFRLVYQGKLPAATHGNTRAKEKHEVRQRLHPQLLALFTSRSRLQMAWLNRGQFVKPEWTHSGFEFVPLVHERSGSVCALDILFLRRERPGELVTNEGDIDNRLKVLFDALRLPKNKGELAGATPGNGETPFCCLLEDDKLITEVRVVTDELLAPKSDSEPQNYVELVLHVRTIALNSPFM